MKRLFPSIGFRKIFIGFLAVVGIAALNVSFSYYIVNKSKASTEEMMQIVNPYLESLERFNMLVTECRMYTTTWVYMQIHDEEKKKLVTLQDEEYPDIKNVISGQLRNFPDKNERIKVDRIFNAFEGLMYVNRNIMNNLASFDDYEKPKNRLFSEYLLEGEVFTRSERIRSELSELIRVNRINAEKIKTETEASLENLVRMILVSSIGLLVIVLLAALFISRSITQPILKMKEHIILLGKGEIPPPVRIEAHDVVGTISEALNLLIRNLSGTLEFAGEIGKGNLDAEYVPLSEKDEVGHALLSMRKSLKEYSARMEQEVEERTKKLKEYSSALEKNEKKNRDLVNYSQALICTHDLSGVLLSVNPALRMSLGYREEQMVGKSIQEFLVPDQRDKFQEYVESINGSETSDGIMLVQSREGERKFFLYKNYRLSEEGAVPYIIGFSQDITRRVMAERELKKAKTLAEESSRAKELFLANMSHEIRTPMNGILGMCRLLAKTSMDEEQAHFLNLIKNSSDNLLVIINDILDISKINSGKVTVESIPFNLGKTISASVQPFIFRAKEKGVVFELRQEFRDNLIATGDPHKLTQVLINLLNNALKFTHKGKIELSVVVTEHADDLLAMEFCVKDTGIGIPKEKLPAIFENFTQAHTDTTRKYGGTGLGLAICKQLIEIQGGQIWAESKEHQGSAFKFRISYKRSSQEMAAKENSAPENYNALGKLKVLLAEDNEISREYAETLMKKWGFVVDCVSDGQRAVILSRKNDYDVILMDIQMPGMNGTDATRIIRSTFDTKKASVPILALTANAFREDHEQYIAAGMNGVVPKPFEEWQLFEAIGRSVKGAYTVTPQSDVAERVPAAAGEKLYDPAALTRITSGDMEFERRMVHLFIRSSNEAMDDMRTGVQQGDWERVRFVAHKIKPNIDRMHIHSLEETIRTIEKYHPGNDHSEVMMDLVDRFTSLLCETVRQLEADYDIAA